MPIPKESVPQSLTTSVNVFSTYAISLSQCNESKLKPGEKIKLLQYVRKMAITDNDNEILSQALGQPLSRSNIKRKETVEN